MKRYYADMSDMRDAGGIADDEFVLSDDYAALKAERDALRERCEKLEDVADVSQTLRRVNRREGTRFTRELRADLDAKLALAGYPVEPIDLQSATEAK